MTQSKHQLFGAFSNAVDNFERSAARAADELQIATAAAARVPGIELPAELQTRLDAFRSAASTGFAAYARDTAPSQLKGLAA